MKKGQVDKDTFFQLFLFKGEHKGGFAMSLKGKGVRDTRKYADIHSTSKTLNRDKSACSISLLGFGACRDEAQLSLRQHTGQVRPDPTRNPNPKTLNPSPRE